MLPTAPDYAETEQQLYPINEITQINVEDFRLKKISDLQTELINEADHYSQVAKKYKTTHSITHISAVGLGSLSAGLSSATLATALTGFGIVASPALAGRVATVFGLFSVGFAAISKRLERKLTKHEKIYTLALAKQNSVPELVSKALTDKRISDSEFTIIIREVQKYHELKIAIRNGEKKKTTTENKEAQTPDLDKLKGELRKEIRKKCSKKIKSNRRIQVRFERVNSGFSLHISKEKSRTPN